MPDKKILLLTMSHNSAASHATTKAAYGIPKDVMTVRGVDEDGYPITLIAERAIEVKNPDILDQYLETHVGKGDRYEVLTSAFHVAAPEDTNRMTGYGMQFARRNSDELGIVGMDEATAVKQIAADANFPRNRL